MTARSSSRSRFTMALCHCNPVTVAESYPQASNDPRMTAKSLPHALSRNKNVKGLTLNQHTPSSDISASTLPVRPIGLPKTPRSHRRPGGSKPPLPHEDPSPFRFFEEDEVSPLTPIDVSPITPRTPRFVRSRHTPAVASSSPRSPQDVRTAIGKVEGEGSRLRNGKSHPQGYLYMSSDDVSDIDQYSTHIYRNTSNFIYEAPQDDEEYVKYIKAEYVRLSQHNAITPLPQSSNKVYTQHHSRKVSQGPQSNDITDPGLVSTQTVSPVDYHRKPSIDQTCARTSYEDPSRRVDHRTHDRKISTTSKSSQRSQYHDFAAAKEALERERAGALGQARVMPTPVKPVLSRIGSKLKSEVKGAFARRLELQDEQARQNFEPRGTESQRVETVHWTELD